MSENLVRKGKRKKRKEKGTCSPLAGLKVAGKAGDLDLTVTN